MERKRAIGTSGADRTSNAGRADDFPAGTVSAGPATCGVLDGQEETFVHFRDLLLSIPSCDLCCFWFLY